MTMTLLSIYLLSIPISFISLIVFLKEDLRKYCSGKKLVVREVILILFISLIPLLNTSISVVLPLAFFFMKMQSKGYLDWLDKEVI